jgi:dTDP-4-dehydrorhamnose 3,5-epimerase
LDAFAFPAIKGAGIGNRSVCKEHIKFKQLRGSVITSIEEANSPESCIEGVCFKQLRTFPDDRGFFRELVRHNDPFFAEGFAQWSHSRMAFNTVKAWHFHHKQIDWWYLADGVTHTALYDNREESPTYQRKMEFMMGEDSLDERALATVVRIPQGVLHGCKVTSDFANLFYITSEVYNPEDEGRLAFNNDSIPHSWGKVEELIVAENDRRDFIPPHPRKKIA